MATGEVPIVSPTEQLRAALRRLVPSAFPRADIVVRLAGEIQVAGSLCDIIALLAQTGRSGTLVVSSSEATRAWSGAKMTPTDDERTSYDAPA